MQVNVQKLSPVLLELDVVVDADRVQSELEKAYNSVTKTAKVRGFRPGKAPRKVIAQLFGARIAADVAQRLVDETYPQAIVQQKVQVVSQPAIEQRELVELSPFGYKARVEIIPEIAGVEYEGLNAKRPKVEVSEEQVNREIDNLRKAHATVEPLKEPRPAEKGDVAVIDFVVEVSGREVKEAGATDFQVELGSGTLIAAIDEALVGKNMGDKVDVDVPMSKQHTMPKLRGKTAKFRITLKDLKQRVLPEADDEFAKDLGEYETLDALKTDIRERIQKQLKEQSDNAVAEQLVRALAERNPTPVPPSLVEQQMRMTEQEIIARARSQGQQATGVAPELREQIRLDSEIKVRAGLLMAEIAKREGIKIGDPEFEEGLKELAEQTGKNLAKMRVEYRDRKKREMLLGMILENKVLDIIEAKAQIVEE
jgi:trigger factor